MRDMSMRGYCTSMHTWVRGSQGQFATSDPSSHREQDKHTRRRACTQGLGTPFPRPKRRASKQARESWTETKGGVTAKFMDVSVTIQEKLVCTTLQKIATLTLA